MFFSFFKLGKCYQIAQRNTCFVLVFAVCLFIVLMARVLIKYPLTLFDHFVYFFLCMWGFICWVSIIGPEIPICFEGLFFKFILKFVSAHGYFLQYLSQWKITMTFIDYALKVVFVPSTDCGKPRSGTKDRNASRKIHTGCLILKSFKFSFGRKSSS